MKKFFSALLLAVLIAPQAMADEGMWLLQLMRQQNLKDKMAEAGLQISVDEIYEGCHWNLRRRMHRRSCFT